MMNDDRQSAPVSRNPQILTLGQYLRPTLTHLPVARYYHPDEFADLRLIASRLGFRLVEAGPLVRSSYHAKRHTAGAQTIVRTVQP